MTTSSNRPSQQDAILGGDAPAPAQAAVLGGLGPVKEQLSSADLATKYAAMKDCLGYGESGVAELIPLLEDSLARTQWEAYQLLRDRPENSVKQALKQYKFWRHFERLQGHPYCHAQMFSNRQVIDFDELFNGASNIQALALGFRENKWSSWNDDQKESLDKKLIDFLTLHHGDLLEAVVLGYGADNSKGSDLLIRERSSLPNLKAIFLGDIEDQEQMISNIAQSDLSLLLGTYPALEVLHVRGDMTMWLKRTGISDYGLRFSSMIHQSLTTLIVETGGLNHQAIDDICGLSLPALEYLELWMGSEDYGSDSTVDNLMPIISGEAFPGLKYLGLRNCEYADEIAMELSKYPARSSLIELDLSMGSLTDVGLKPLIRSGVLDSLETLNVSQCVIPQNFLSRLSKLNCSVICDGQRHIRGRPSQSRYCVVGE